MKLHFLDREPSIKSLAGAALLLLVASVPRVAGTAYQINLVSGLSGIGLVIDQTGLATAQVWLFTGAAVMIIAGVLLRVEPSLGWFDGILAGTGLLWTSAYLLGQTVGPIGLFRAPVIWAILLFAAVFLSFRLPSHISPSTGASERRLAVLAAILIGLVILPLQLGSPVVPYYDVLSYPASAQRIVSFGYYLPFDNDPFGCWGPQAQTPGLELLYALIAMGSNTKLALLAESSLIAPVAVLLVCATYKLGATLINEDAGAMAALMLPLTIIFRRSVGMRGTAIDLALVAIALGFLFDRNRSRLRITLGGLFLGTAIASHSIDGGLGAIVAAVGVLGFLISGEFGAFGDSVIILFGVVAIAAPDFAITLAHPVTYPILPLIQIGGIALVLFGARSLAARNTDWFALPAWLNHALIVAFLLAVTMGVMHERFSVIETVARNFPITTMAAALGTLGLGFIPAKVSARLGALAIMPLFIGIGLEVASGSLWAFSSAEAFRSAVSDLVPKLQEYWMPYFLIFPAAIPFALLYRYGSRVFTVLLLLAIVIFPWNQRLNASYDYVEHSLAEELGITLSTAAGGYWFSAGDARWAMPPDGFALIDFLNREQAAGRITTDTHILHLANDVKVNGDFNRYSVYTGINDDPIVNDIPSTDTGWLAGGRVRRMGQLREALKTNPPYILEQVQPPEGVTIPPPGYKLVFERGNLRLYRRD